MGTTRAWCRGCFPVGDWTISTGVEHVELPTHPGDGNDGDDGMAMAQSRDFRCCSDSATPLPGSDGDV